MRPSERIKLADFAEDYRRRIFTKETWWERFCNWLKGWGPL